MDNFGNETVIDFSDRRSSPRARVDNLLCDVSSSNGDKTFEGRIMNISSRGLMLVIKEPLSISRTSNINIHLPQPYGDISIKGVVAWVDKVDNSFVCGIDFPERKKGNILEILKGYVNSIMAVSNIIDRRKKGEMSGLVESKNDNRRVSKIHAKQYDKAIKIQQTIPVSIIGTGFYVPDRVILNSEYEKEYGIESGWIEQATGVQERRVVSKAQTIADLATNAAKRAIKNANISPEEIDLIILTTTLADFIVPPTSCIIQRNIGAKNASCFDQLAACMGYIWAMNTASAYIGSGVFDTVLVIASEITTQGRNFKNKASFHLLGDGAGAAILRKSREKERGILATYSEADGNQWNVAATIGFMSRAKEASPDLKHFNMEGLEIYKFAVNAMPNAINRVIEKAGIKKEDVALIIPHQANLRILESAWKKSGFPREKFFFNIQKYGNTSSASIAIAFAEARDKELLKDGDIVVLVGFGSGLAWGATALKL
jgi:3-oxoacyl-[acyl-carrier-protein] synthase-3